MITKTGKVNGGKRPSAGRPKGSVSRDRAEQRHIAEQLLEEGLTPLDIMRARMLGRQLSNGTLVTDDQFAAACALAPYLHPKLTAVAVRDMTPDIGTQIEDNGLSVICVQKVPPRKVSKINEMAPRFEVISLI